MIKPLISEESLNKFRNILIASLKEPKDYEMEKKVELERFQAYEEYKKSVNSSVSWVSDPSISTESEPLKTDSNRSYKFPIPNLRHTFDSGVVNTKFRYNEASPAEELHQVITHFVSEENKPKDKTGLNFSYWEDRNRSDNDYQRFMESIHDMKEEDMYESKISNKNKKIKNLEHLCTEDPISAFKKHTELDISYEEDDEGDDEVSSDNF